MTGAILAILLAAGAAGPAAALDDTATIPPLMWIELLRVPPEPASLFCVPAGEGEAFVSADTYGGAAVDATLEIVLWSDQPGWGDPIAFFPRQDMWLESAHGSLAPCPGGTIADADTDAEGRTLWSLPLRTGGTLDRAAGDRLVIVVNGDYPQGVGDVPLGLTSADLNGDGLVNLTDAGVFATDLFGTYRYRSDFVWDGLINLSDAGRMASALGRHCP